MEGFSHVPEVIAHAIQLVEADTAKVVQAAVKEVKFVEADTVKVVQQDTVKVVQDAVKEVKVAEVDTAKVLEFAANDPDVWEFEAERAKKKAKDDPSAQKVGNSTPQKAEKSIKWANPGKDVSQKIDENLRANPGKVEAVRVLFQSLSAVLNQLTVILFG